MLSSFCRINDLDTALNHIISHCLLATFSQTVVWFEDDQISAERKGDADALACPRTMGWRYRQLKPVNNADQATPPLATNTGTHAIAAPDDAVDAYHDDHQRYH